MWDKELPLLVVAEPEQEAVVKSFRNLAAVYVVSSAETDVAELVWARSVLATESALQRLEVRAR
jgi:ribosomal protein L4